MFFIALGFGVFTLMTQLFGDKNFEALGCLTGSALLIGFIVGCALWAIFVNLLNIFLIISTKITTHWALEMVLVIII